jgi:hypothetical protein
MSVINEIVSDSFASNIVKFGDVFKLNKQSIVKVINDNNLNEIVLRFSDGCYFYFLKDSNNNPFVKDIKDVTVHKLIDNNISSVNGTLIDLLDEMFVNYLDSEFPCWEQEPCPFGFFHVSKQGEIEFEITEREVVCKPTVSQKL